MTVMDLKREIAALEPIVQDELTAFLVQLRLQRDPEHAREMSRRRDDRRPESWVRLEDFEAEITGGNGAFVRKTTGDALTRSSSSADWRSSTT